jgi:hypothetical protein
MMRRRHMRVVSCMSRLTVLVSVFALLTSTAASAQAAEPMSAQELYQGYAQWLHLMHTSLAFHETEEMTVSGYDWTFDRMVSKRFVCRDGERSAAFVDEESSMKGKARPNSSRVRALYTEEQEMAYSGRLGQRPRGMIIDTRPQSREARERLRSNGGCSLALDGHIFGDNRLWITDIAQQAREMLVHPKTEIVDGHETLALEIDGDYGKHMIWIDPACGYCARRLMVVKEPGDLWDKTRVGQDTIRRGPSARSVLQRHELRVDAVVLEKIGDVYVPVSGTITDQLEFANGEKASIKSVFQREEITTKPDFEAVRKEFLAGIPDGVPLSFMDDVRKGIRYEWYHGGPRAAVSDQELKALDQAISEAGSSGDGADVQHKGSADANVGSANPRAAEAAVVPPRQQSSVSRASWQWLLIPCAVLFIGAVGSCLVIRSRRKERVQVP